MNAPRSSTSGGSGGRMTGLVSPGFLPPTHYRLTHLRSCIETLVTECPVSVRPLREFATHVDHGDSPSRLVIVGNRPAPDVPVRSNQRRFAAESKGAHGSNGFSRPGQSFRRYAFRCKGVDFLVACDDEAIYLREQLLSKLGSDDLGELLFRAVCYHSLDSQDRNDPVPAGTQRWVLDRLIEVDQRSPGQGITSQRATELASDGDFLDKLDLLPGMSRQVRANARYLIAEHRAAEFRGAIRGPDEGFLQDALADILADETPIEPTNIEFVSFGSPWHYALWNNLSVEALMGDLLAEYGDEVAISVLRLDRLDLVDRAFTRENASFPAIVGLSVELGTLQLVDRFLDLFSRDPRARRCILVLGNQLPTYFPERFLNDPRIPNGVVCLHEGELAMRGLVEFSRGRTQLQDINNIVFRGAETRAVFRTPLVNLDLKALPHPPSVDTVKPGITNMIQTSRGCVFSCTYCTRWRSFNAGAKVDAVGAVTIPSSSTKWRYFSLERVFQNIETFVSHGISEIEFCDDEFFGGRSVAALRRIHDFAAGMMAIEQKYRKQISFRIFTTPLIVSREPTTQKIADENCRIRNALQCLKSAGLTRVYIGLESGSWAQKQRYNRKETIADTLSALKVLEELDLDIDVGFIMFDPHLTIQELLGNVRFFRENGIVRYNTWPFRPLVVNEGTAIKETLEKQHLLTGDHDPNFMSFGYRFADPSIAAIAEAVDRTSRSSAPVFYALKTISKSHWKGGDEAVDFAAQTVQENAEIYLEMMESLGEAALIGCMNEELGQICTQAEREVCGLVNRIRRTIARGVFQHRSEDETVLLGHIEAYSNKQKSINAYL